MKISISSNADKDLRTGRFWGDFWVKYHLANAFRELGHEIVEDNCDLLFELFGGPVNLVKNYKLRTCWFYSHPEMMSMEVAKGYDIIFTKSKTWAEVFNEEKIKTVHLIGCTHCVPPEDREINHYVVFVGNARWRGTKYGRPVINDLDPENMPLCSEPYRSLELYGLHWRNFPPSRPYYAGPEWDNLKLNELYGKATISLADCYGNMVEHGFANETIFNIVGSGGVCISMPVRDIGTIFKEAVVTYKSPGDLQDKVRYYLLNSKAREKKIKKGLELVKGHTYIKRAETILQEVNSL